MLNYIIWLCVLFQFKHFIADYPLQTPYMLGKFKSTNWQIPLASHCLVHAMFSFFIGAWFTNSFYIGLLCSVIDFIIHFIMDRIKASPNLLGRYNALSKIEMADILNQKSINEKLGFTEVVLDERLKSNQLFWYALGIDQLIHHLTDLLIIFIIVSRL